MQENKGKHSVLSTFFYLKSNIFFISRESFLIALSSF